MPEVFGNITFDRKKLKKLEELYDSAVKNKQETFFLDDHLLLTSYAKYLIEHLKLQGL